MVKICKGQFPILSISSSNNTRYIVLMKLVNSQEFTRTGDLNPQRTERFCANIACVDRKVDLQIRVECAHVVPHDTFRYCLRFF